MGNVAERAAYYENEVWFQNLLKLPQAGEINLNIFVYPDDIFERHLDEFSHQLTDRIYVMVSTDDHFMEFKHGVWFVENCLFDPNVHNINLTFQINGTDADVSVMPQFLSHFPIYDRLYIMNHSAYGMRLDFLRNIGEPSNITLASYDHAARELIANVPPELITPYLQDIIWDSLQGGGRHRLSEVGGGGLFPVVFFNERQRQAFDSAGIPLPPLLPLASPSPSPAPSPSPSYSPLYLSRSPQPEDDSDISE